VSFLGRASADGNSVICCPVWCLRLNRDIPAKVIDDALERLLDRRQAMSLVAANQEVYNLLRDGIPVEFDNFKGVKQQEHVKLIDFNQPGENRYLAVTQIWIKGERGFRRPDVLLYVNGLPLVFIELKNSNVKLCARRSDLRTPVDCSRVASYLLLPLTPTAYNRIGC
jgi:Type I restriction enzyme R protein N terminus (HSDR_N)